MIKCPKCQATLPDGTGFCQFCQTSFDVKPVPAVSADGESPASPPLNLKWVWPVYYGLAGWWVFNGILGVIQGLFPHRKDAGPNIFVIAISAITLLVGIGLLARVEFVRRYVNFISFLQILFGLFGLFSGFIFSFALGFWGAFIMITNILQIVLAGLMIFVLGETESQAANY